MSLSKIEKKFFNDYLATTSPPLKVDHVEAGIAGNIEIADELLALYLDGKKTAGSGLLKDYQKSGDAIPKVGNHWIILNSNKEPKCIVKTIRVELYNFNEVPEEVAIAEGEGDLSLKYWRDAHLKFFNPYLKELGIEDINTEIIVTEFFEVVYK